MKLVNMVKERGYENIIEESIKIAAPFIEDGKNISVILDEWSHKGIIPAEVRQYFEVKLESAKIVLMIERLFAEYGLDAQGIIYLLDNESSTNADEYGTLHFITAPNIGEHIMRKMNQFVITPTNGSCGKSIYHKGIYTTNDPYSEEAYNAGHHEVFRENNIQAITSVPIFTNDRVVATCGLLHHNKIEHIPEELTKRLMNKIHSLEETLDRLQHEWKEIRVNTISAFIQPNGQVAYCDSNLEFSLGIHPREFIGKSLEFDNFVIDEDKPYIRKAFMECVNKKEPTTIVYRVNSPLPEVGEVTLQTLYKPVLNADGSVRCVESETTSNTFNCKKFQIDLQRLKMAVK